MKINRGALIFGGVTAGAILLIAGGIWFSSLFTADNGGAQEKPNFFSALFPFGKTPTGGQSGTGTQNGTFAPSGPAPTLREVSHAPVGGAHFQKTGALRYIERETGHVYETKPESLATTRISNTTIPGIQKVVWLGDQTFVLQYLDESGAIRNYLTGLASSTPDQSLTGKFLSGFTDVLPSTDEKSFILAARSSAGIAVFDSDTAEKKRTLLFASPLRSWVLTPVAGTLYVGTAPSAQPGYFYKVNGPSSLTRILGGLPGLMALPDPSGAFVAFSATNSSGTSLSFFDTKKNGASVSPISTFAEKCAWIPGATPLLFCGIPSSLSEASPEEWFMGVQSFSDSAWVINPVQGTAQIVRDLEKDAGRPIDIINPAVSADGTYVTFTNKNDLSLWSLLLEK